MSRYAKRPIEVEAFQISGETFASPSEAECSMMSDRRLKWFPDGSVQVATLEGAMTAQPGEWIIKGVEGELYPCRDDIFQKTYREVGDE